MCLHKKAAMEQEQQCGNSTGGNGSNSSCHFAMEKGQQCGNSTVGNGSVGNKDSSCHVEQQCGNSTVGNGSVENKDSSCHFAQRWLAQTFILYHNVGSKIVGSNIHTLS